jgi:hypothetical protein
MLMLTCSAGSDLGVSINTALKEFDYRSILRMYRTRWEIASVAGLSQSFLSVVAVGW